MIPFFSLLQQRYSCCYH